MRCYADRCRAPSHCLTCAPPPVSTRTRRRQTDRQTDWTSSTLMTTDFAAAVHAEVKTIATNSRARMHIIREPMSNQWSHGMLHTLRSDRLFIFSVSDCRFSLQNFIYTKIDYTIEKEKINQSVHNDSVVKSTS